jgi:hypothetical protein
MIIADMSQVTPSITLFTTQGFYKPSIFETYLKIVRKFGVYSPIEKGFLVSRISAFTCATALKEIGFQIEVTPAAHAVFFKKQEQELPLPMTFSMVAKSMVASGQLSKQDASFWL